MRRPTHILTKEELTDFSIAQIMASDSDAGKRLTAVFDIGALAHRFDLYQWNGKNYQYQQSFIDIDQAIAAYNKI